MVSITRTFAAARAAEADAFVRALEADDYQVVRLVADDGIIIVTGTAETHDALIEIGGAATSFAALIVAAAPFLLAWVATP